MHELGIVYQLAKTIDGIKAEQGISRVDTIVLEIGEMSDVVPEFITEAWKSAKDSLGYGDTTLEVQIITARARCKQCGKVFDVRSISLECPTCKSYNFEIISGREFLIKEIHI